MRRQFRHQTIAEGQEKFRPIALRPVFVRMDQGKVADDGVAVRLAEGAKNEHEAGTATGSYRHMLQIHCYGEVRLLSALADATTIWDPHSSTPLSSISTWLCGGGILLTIRR